MLRDCIVTVQSFTQNEEELRATYGLEAVVSRVGSFNLIHLDAPSPEEVLRRRVEFDPDLLFEDDCPLCRSMKRQGVDVIYVSVNERQLDS
jgi:hypothetical protein